MAVIKCPGCGANNLDTGKGVRCEYCSSYLETTVPDPVPVQEKNTNVFTIPIPNLSEIPVLGKFFKTAKPHTDDYDPWAETGNTPAQKKAASPYPPVSQKKNYDYSEETTAAPARPKKRRKLLFTLIPIFFVVFFFAMIGIMIDGGFGGGFRKEVEVNNIEMHSRQVAVQGGLIIYDLEINIDVENDFNSSKEITIVCEIYSHSENVTTLTFKRIAQSGRSRLVETKRMGFKERPTEIKVKRIEWE